MQQSTTGYIDDAPVNMYYRISATDFNGNISEYALASPKPADMPAADGPMMLSLRLANPATADKVTAVFVLPKAGVGLSCAADSAMTRNLPWLRRSDTAPAHPIRPPPTRSRAHGALGQKTHRQTDSSRCHTWEALTTRAEL